MTRAALLASLINSSNTLTAVDFTDTGNTVFGDASVDTLTINGTNVSIPNNLNIGANTFFINSSNNRVGINTTLPLNALDVTGNVSVTGSITESNLNLQGGNNLLIYSQDFANAAWTKSSSATATAATFIAPDGTLTGQTCTFPSSSYIAQSFTVAGIYTFSIYCHIISTNWVCIENYNSPLDKAVWFNLSTGVVGTQSNATGTISSVGNGWYKCSITMTAVSTNISIFNFFTVTADNSFTRSGSVYAWGAQLELGTVASAYTPTTTAAITTTNNLYVPSGQVIVQSGGTSAPSYSFAGKTTSGMYFGNGPSIAYGGALIVSFGGQTGYDVSMTQGATLKWGSAAGQTTGTDIALERDAANILAQRNSTNAQTFRLYNTYTDASNYERLAFNWATNTAIITTEAAGTGTLRQLNLNANSFAFQLAGSSKVLLNVNGLYPATDNATDFGYAGTNRWRNAYFSGVVTTNSDASINGVTVGLGGGSVSTNTAVGNGAIFNASGANNFAGGLNALRNLSSGSNNNGIGVNVLFSNNTGVSNNVIGTNALNRNTSGGNNCAIGENSLFQNTIASNLTAIGTFALQNNTTNVATLGAVTGGSSYTNGTYTGVVMTLSSGSTAITYPTATIVVSGGAVTTVTLTSNGVGFKDTTTVLTAPAASIGGTGSGFSVPVATLQSGTGNVAVGYQAGYSNSTGTTLTAVGYQAGYSQTTGNFNSYFGNGAGNANQTGIYNTGLGYLALQNNTGSSNTGVGVQTLNSNTGNNSTSIGWLALYANTSGGNNIAIGKEAGRGNASANANTTGSNNTYIGYQTVGSANNNTNEMVIGYQAVGLGSNTTVIGNSSTVSTLIYGNQLYGSTYDQGTGKLQVTGNSTINGIATESNLNLQGGNNYHTYSNTFSDASWGKQNCTVGTSKTDPFGGTTASSIIASSGTAASKGLYKTSTNISSTATSTETYYVKANQKTFCYILFADVPKVWFNLTTGAVGTTLANYSGTIQSIGNSWYRISCTGLQSGTNNGVYACDADNSTACTGDGTTDSIYIFQAQLELGTVASAYTPTTTAAITTTNNISVPSGQVIFPTSTKTAPSIVLGNANTGIYSRVSGSYIMFGVGGNETAYLSNGGAFTVGGSSASIAFSSATLDTTAADLTLYRDSANTLAQRNSTNAQTFRLYGTYTDASNYERLGINWSSNTATIQTENAGTGTARDLKVISASKYVILGTEGANRLVVDSLVNNFYPSANGTWDLGYSTNKWRNANFSGVVTTNSDASINTVTVGLGGGSVSTNTAVGQNALLSTNTQGYNTAIGNASQQLSTSGKFNVSIGYATLANNISGTSNVAMGQGASQYGTAIFNTVALGNSALQFNQGSSCVAIGSNALSVNTAASNLTAIGTSALQANTTNVATLGAVTGGSSYTNGTYTGVVMTLSSGSSAITYPTATIVVAGGVVTTVTLTSNGVGFKDTTTVLTAPAASIGGTGSGFTVPVATLASGTGNVAVGYQAGYTNSTGFANTFMGYQAGYSNSYTTGQANAYFGYQAGYTSGIGQYNSCFGYQAGYSISSGASNVIIGNQAGQYLVPLTTGNNNTYIGNGAHGSVNSNSNEIAIGNLSVGLGSNTTVIGNSSTTLTKAFGVIVGTNYTVATLPSASTSGVGARAFVTDALTPVFGSAVTGGGAVAIPVYSDGTNWNVG